MSSKAWHPIKSEERVSQTSLILRKESKRSKLWLALGLGLAAGLALFFFRTYLSKERRVDQSPFTVRNSLLLFDKERKDQTDLASLLEDLSHNDDATRENTRKRIVELGRQSKENRQIIITELIRRVGAPEFRQQQLATRAGSFFWVEASKILYGLKAVEAIDVLIDCIDCLAVTQAATDTYHHRPAIGALIALGQPAVPKLAQTLANPNPQIRIYACVCLGNIQGSAARQALTDALANEKNSDVQAAIENAIAAIDRGI